MSVFECKAVESLKPLNWNLSNSYLTMQNHSSVTVPKELKQKLQEEKGDYQTWAGFLHERILEGNDR